MAIRLSFSSLPLFAPRTPCRHALPAFALFAFAPAALAEAAGEGEAALTNVLLWMLVITFIAVVAMTFAAVRYRLALLRLRQVQQQSRQAEDAHQKTDALNRTLLQAVEQSPTSIVVTDLLARIEYVNHCFEERTGYRAEEAIGKNPRVLKSGKTEPKIYLNLWETLLRGEIWRGQFVNKRKDGCEYIEQATIAPVRDASGNIAHYVAVKEDITLRLKHEQRIYRLAYFDRLTNLPNRTFLLEQLKRLTRPGQTRPAACALLLTDIDRFKRINEARDHTLGDLILQSVAGCLREVVRKPNVAVRIGSDQFGVILHSASDTSVDIRALAHQIAEQIRQQARAPALPEEAHEPVTLTFSIGFTLFPDDGDDSPSDVLRRAESALYRAKKRGGNQVLSFEEHMLEEERQTFLIESALRAALPAEQLCLYLQQLTNSAGEPVGCEALIRWQHPERGLIMPAAFIRIAEESDLICEIDAWVLREACRISAQEARAGRPLPISVNISPRHFRHHDFVRQFQEVLTDTGADPACITLEITENLLLEDLNEVITRMTELAALGVHFSIDDFGTGYSSLSYLKRLPISEMKIDRSFVRNAPNDAGDAALVETIVSVARHMHLRIIAEGVETAAQAEFMRQWPEVIQQGFLYGRPEPAQSWLERWHQFPHPDDTGNTPHTPTAPAP